MAYVYFFFFFFYFFHLLSSRSLWSEYVLVDEMKGSDPIYYRIAYQFPDIVKVWSQSW